MASFYTDNDIPINLARRLRANRHIVVTVRSLGTGKAGDDEHLLTAAQAEQVFITHNVKDFILLQNAWRRWSAAWGVAPQHAGILILPQRIPIHELESAILRLLASEESLRTCSTSGAERQDGCVWVTHKVDEAVPLEIEGSAGKTREGRCEPSLSRKRAWLPLD